MSVKPRLSDIVSTNTQRINAIRKHITNGRTEIPIDGQLVKIGAVTASYQGSLDAQAAVVYAHGQYKTALDARDTAEEHRLHIDEGLKLYVMSTFGGSGQVARDFGYAPPKVGVKTVETKSNAIELGKATRVARGTMGKKERLKIKGTLPSQSVTAVSSTTPSTAPAATSHPPVTTATTVAPATAASQPST